MPPEHALEGVKGAVYVPARVMSECIIQIEQNCITSAKETQAQIWTSQEKSALAMRTCLPFPCAAFVYNSYTSFAQSY
jgi:hypothetical protein